MGGKPDCARVSYSSYRACIYTCMLWMFTLHGYCLNTSFKQNHSEYGMVPYEFSSVNSVAASLSAEREFWLIFPPAYLRL